MDISLTGLFTPLQRDLFHKINSYKVSKLNKIINKSEMFSTNFAYCEMEAGVIWLLSYLCIMLLVLTSPLTIQQIGWLVSPSVHLFNHPFVWSLAHQSADRSVHLFIGLSVDWSQVSWLVILSVSYLASPSVIQSVCPPIPL